MRRLMSTGESVRLGCRRRRGGNTRSVIRVSMGSIPDSASRARGGGGGRGGGGRGAGGRAGDIPGDLTSVYSGGLVGPRGTSAGPGRLSPWVGFASWRGEHMDPWFGVHTSPGICWVEVDKAASPAAAGPSGAGAAAAAAAAGKTSLPEPVSLKEPRAGDAMRGAPSISSPF